MKLVKRKGIGFKNLINWEEKKAIFSKREFWKQIVRMWKEKENFEEKNDSPNVRRDAADDYDANDTDANNINDNDVTMMLMSMLLMIHDYEPQLPAIWYCLETALWILILKSSFANFLFLTIYISHSNNYRNREKISEI